MTSTMLMTGTNMTTGVNVTFRSSHRSPSRLLDALVGSLLRDVPACVSTGPPCFGRYLSVPVLVSPNGRRHASRLAARQAAFCVYKPKEQEAEQTKGH